MKPLNPKQFFEVMKFVQDYHRFAYWPSDEDWKKITDTYPLMPHYGLSIKYIDACYDTRDGSVWSISFRGMAGDVNFSSNHFSVINPAPRGWKYESLYELVMAYLTGQFVPKTEFYFKLEENVRNTRKMYSRQQMIDLVREYSLSDENPSHSISFEEWLDKKEHES